MSRLHANHTNNRFAWLTPLQGQETHSGPWVLCENRTQHLANSDIECTSVTVNALLRLLGLAFGNQAQHVITSECNRFEARKYKQSNDNSRLFVQQRSDYFQRLELFVDNQLVAAFHEPVWPHLQHKHPITGLRLNVPVACVELLEDASYALQDGTNEEAPIDVNNSAAA